MTALSLFVPGSPAPQGSKRHVGNGRMVESSPNVGQWRNLIVLAVQQHYAALGEAPPCWDEPCSIYLVFWMPRPKSRPHDIYHATAPDTDKLMRACFDALETASVVKNDACFVVANGVKRYALPGWPVGVDIKVVRPA